MPQLRLPKAHRRQLLLGPRPFLVDETWINRQLAPNIWLSHCPDLRIAFAPDMDGKHWCIAGLAISSADNFSEPSAAIKQTPSHSVPQQAFDWTGRYLLFCADALYLDVNGLLGCFYGRDSSGALWISTSPTLAVRVMLPGRKLDQRKLRHESGFSWITPPSSRFEGIARLLPSQSLDLQTGEVKRREWLPPLESVTDLESGLQQLQTLLLNTLRRFPSESKIWLGLSGGYDSRLMAVLAREAGIECHTFTRVTKRMSLADRYLPPQLAQALNLPHVFLNGGPAVPEHIDLARVQSADYVSKGDAQPWLHNARGSLSGISFGGHGFALASGFYRVRELPEQVVQTEKLARDLAKMFGEPGASMRTQGIQQWLEWVKLHPHPGLDWRDRFFIEQRQAGWLSSKEQLYDLETCERVPMLNCARVQVLLLGFADSARLGSQLQERLLNKLAPDLMKYPINPPNRSYGWFKSLSVELARILRMR